MYDVQSVSVRSSKLQALSFKRFKFNETGGTPQPRETGCGMDSSALRGALIKQLLRYS